MTSRELDLKAYGSLGTILAIANLVVEGVKNKNDAIFEIQRIAKEFSDECRDFIFTNNKKVRSITRGEL
jgi:hypothetical protein